jgi:Cof subfamily protein (haloacid dehalogenase superfamily)
LNIKLIVTDLDNTLFRRGKTVSKHTVNVFRQLRECGVLVAFATARSLENVAEFQKQIQADGLILTNGAIVMSNGEILRESFLPVETSRAVLLELAANPNMLKISARQRNKQYSTAPAFVDSNHILYDFKTPLDEGLLHLSFRTKDSDFATAIIAKYPQLSICHVSNENLYDVNPISATKVNGIRILSNHYNIALTDIAAFGDDFNDVEMLKFCGVSVAMSNAIDECKTVADYVCGDCDDDGVVRWIEQNVLSAIG